MDNENLNPYDQMMPQPDDPDKNSEKNKERKKHGFAAGVESVWQQEQPER